MSGTDFAVTHGQTLCLRGFVVALVTGAAASGAAVEEVKSMR